MDTGTYLLWLGALTGVGSAGLSLVSAFARAPLYRQVARILLLASFLLATAAFLFLVYLFQATDLTIDYVFRHSTASYDAFYKLAGVWSGDKGSVLLWAWLIGLSLFVEEGVLWRRRRRRSAPGPEREVADWIRFFAVSVYVAMLLLVVSLDLFARTNPALLVSRAGTTGWGLNPILQTPMVIVHPPMEFLGYALVTLPFAASLAFLVTNDRTWVETSLQWGRVAWIAYTLAIVLGAIWAYTVLGWGGYWAWDPVETVNLIAWIALTAFVHAQVRFRQRRAFTWVAPALGVLSFVLTVFATFETRSGYVNSVHTFTSLGTTRTPPATEKLLLVIAGIDAGDFLVSLMLVSLFVAAALFLWRFHQIRKGEARGEAPRHLWVPRLWIALLAVLATWSVVDLRGLLRSVFAAGAALAGGNADWGTLVLVLALVGIPVGWVVLTGPESPGPAGRRRELVNDDTTMAVAVAIFSLWFFVTFALLILGVNGLDAEVFESRLPLLVVPLGLTLVAALVWRELGTERILVLVAILTVLSVLAHFLLEPGRFWVYVPVAVTGMAVSVHGLWKSLDLRRVPWNLRAAGLLLLVSGILGMFMWGVFPTRVALGPLAFDVTLPLAFLGFTLSIAPLVGAAIAIRSRNTRVAAGTALLGIAALGYLLGAILAAAALVLLVRRARAPAPATTLDLRTSRPAMHRAAAHLIHLGVATLLLAYAASAALGTDEVVEVVQGRSASSAGYSLHLTGIALADAQGGFYERVESTVRVYRDGGLVGVGELVFRWEFLAGRFSYSAAVDVTVLPLEDLYFRPLAFHVTGGDWIQVGAGGAALPVGGTVDRVAFQFLVKPLVGVLWAGVWMMVGGMVLRVIIDHGRPHLARWNASTLTGPVLPRRPSYDERLEEELHRSEGGA